MKSSSGIASDVVKGFFFKKKFCMLEKFAWKDCFPSIEIIILSFLFNFPGWSRNKINPHGKMDNKAKNKSENFSCSRPKKNLLIISIRALPLSIYHQKVLPYLFAGVWASHQDQVSHSKIIL